MTKGRAGIRPAATSSSARRISAAVPPRCTVPAPASRASRHGIGPSSRKSTLDTDGPGRHRRRAAAYRGGRPVPATRSTWRGVRSSTTASAAGSARRSVTSWPRCSRPPCARSTATSASTIAPDPPRATGQPELIPSAPKSAPNAAVRGRLEGRIAWAAEPVNRARAASVRNIARPSRSAGHGARRPKRAIATGWGGGRSTGPSAPARISSTWSTRAPCTARQARASTPRPAAVASRSRCRRAAGPSGSGCPIGTAGCSQASPWSVSPSSRNTGLATPNGWPAAPRSTTVPSPSTGADAHAPPGTGARSNTSTSQPSRASRAAAVRPLGPAPTTTARPGSTPRGRANPGPAAVSVMVSSCGP